MTQGTSAEHGQGARAASKGSPTDQATPRPWTYEQFERNGLFGFHAKAGDVVIAEAYPQPWPVAVNEANAALIVRAVNCHDELVAALQCLLVAIDCGGHAERMENSNPRCVTFARAILSQARPNE